MNTLQKIGFRLLYGIAYVFSLLPMYLLYVVGQFLFFLLYFVVGYRRDVVIQNISRSFPYKKYSEVKAVSKQFYKNLANYFVEILKSISAPLSFYEDKITFKNFEQIKTLVSEGKTILAGMGHMTNWEVLNILPAKENIPATAVYKTQSSSGMNALMQKIRSRFGMQLVTSNDIAKRLLSKSDTNRLFIFIADQSPVYSNEEEKIVFLNQKTQMFNGLEKLALKVDAEVVYLKMTQDKKAHYTVECMYLGNAQTLCTKGAITDAYSTCLEQNIIEQPSAWLWTHKRWKR